MPGHRMKTALSTDLTTWFPELRPPTFFKVQEHLLMRSRAQISIITQSTQHAESYMCEGFIESSPQPSDTPCYYHCAANKETQVQSGVPTGRARTWVPTQADCSQLPHYRVSACVPGQGLAPCTGSVSSWSLTVTRKSTS